MCINSVYVTVIITVLVQSAHTVPALTMPIITDQPITLHHLLHFNCNLPWHAQAVCLAVGTQRSRQRSAITTKSNVICSWICSTGGVDETKYRYLSKFG
ncbi:hypothetical protein PF005_g13273 [Phytophthora fragariae]|uniref:Secreted protein n=1 Tax=Phytophthora fragariae TaxID=53985 RepID=A0A6A3ZWC7_9STRA|nr:hypothetical protein PF003_g40365 [Phytophthora fragariae]KAE8969581.1 hypothetical protein PF011_g26748 [Phytophthora fragariae]KAE9205783.1 hypothetical protein PF005_g13273 [Phytophthora fragariae]KAE9240952.1 hypothetical protein PF002_g9494 [Phytophthora fragariae]KAE9270801.1 hypothetical protein PF008_g30513 [Phytophthora fragariae]